jgi:hypothetical protein
MRANQCDSARGGVRIAVIEPVRVIPEEGQGETHTGGRAKHLSRTIDRS